MSNKVITLTKEEKKIIYLQAIPMCSKEFNAGYRNLRKKRAKSSDRSLYEIQHRLRIKFAIFGCIFHTYHPDMNFTNAENAGWVKQIH